MLDLPVREAIAAIRARAEARLFPAPSQSSQATTSFHRTRAALKGFAFTPASMKASVVKRSVVSEWKCSICPTMHSRRHKDGHRRATCSDECLLVAKANRGGRA